MMKSNLLRVMTALLALPLLASPALADPGGGHGGYGDHYMGFGGGMFGSLAMVLLLVLTVMAVVLLLRWMGIGEVGKPRNRAIDVLDERFARGEIDKSEFEERRRALGE